MMNAVLKHLSEALQVLVCKLAWAHSAPLLTCQAMEHDFCMYCLQKDEIWQEEVWFGNAARLHAHTSLLLEAAASKLS